MRAAIYARKSTEQNDVANEATSVARQVDGARAFIQARGWSLDEMHVYEDDGVSGALFLKRPSFQRMMRDADAGAFDAVVFFDLDRFGRHAHKTMEALHALADVGVEVYDYSTGRCVDVDSTEGETMTYLRASYAQQFRELIRKHTRAALYRKAEQGFVAGCKVFGYDNVGPKGQRRLRENKVEADVVREIYGRFAEGEGARSIAEALNARGVPAPRAQQGRKSGWSLSTIFAVLDRPLYRGRVVYGRTQKVYDRELKKARRESRKMRRDDKREKAQLPRPRNSWVCLDVPAYRIVDPKLTACVDALREERRTRYLASLKRRDGRAPEKAHGKYLLSGGMLICPSCGGHFEARKHPWKGAPGEVYICATRRRKPGICSNTLALPIAQADSDILSIIEGEVLGPRVIDELVALAATASDETGRLSAERDRVRAEVERLVESIAAGVPAKTVAPQIQNREAQLSRLEAQLQACGAEPPDLTRLRAALEQRTADWRRDLRAEPKIARLVLRRLVGPLTLHDESERPEWVRWEAKTTPARLADGLVLLVPSPTGFEPVFQP
jgi:site-specific DNA recombinase